MSSSTSDDVKSDDASQLPHTDNSESSQAAARENREAHAPQQRPRQDEPTREGPISQPRQLVDEPDTMVESSQRTSSQSKSRQRQSSQGQTCKPKVHKSRATESRRQKLNGYLSTGYRDLLNSVIDDVRAGSGCTDDSIDPARVGASHWRPSEKAHLFKRLESCDLGNLRLLQEVVPTKSESEIQSYLLLLRQVLSDQSVRSKGKDRSKDVFAHVDVPAAVEISEDCERYLELAADALAARVDASDVDTEQRRCGSDWLVDDNAAAEMDLEYQDHRSDLGSPSARTENEDHATVSTPSTLQRASAAVEVLRPSAFLQLSRDLFMNNGEDPDLNWRSVETISEAEVPTEPAMFRSTIEDFYSITVSLTRRLVQATLFQARSRLRAMDASRRHRSPAARIRESDVWSAGNVLNMKTDRKRYWAQAPRRCRVMLFTDSTRYKDGRPGTKTGWGLTVEEAEAELGLEAANEYIELDEADADAREEDGDATMQEKDNLTDASHSADDQTSTFHATSTTDDESRPNSRSRTRKRRRALSPASFCRAETRFLEALDRREAFEEEGRLYTLLRNRIPRASSRQDKTMTARFGSLPETEKASGDWRSKSDYKAEWELPCGVVSPEHFEEMEVRGRRGRKRRRIVRRKEQGRLDAGGAMTQGDSGSSADRECVLEGNDDGNLAAYQDQRVNLEGGEAASGQTPVAHPAISAGAHTTSSQFMDKGIPLSLGR